MIRWCGGASVDAGPGDLPERHAISADEFDPPCHNGMPNEHALLACRNGSRVWHAEMACRNGMPNATAILATKLITPVFHEVENEHWCIRVPGLLPFDERARLVVRCIVLEIVIVVPNVTVDCEHSVS